MNGSHRFALLAALLVGCGGRAVRDGGVGMAGAATVDAGTGSAGTGGATTVTDWSSCGVGDSCVLEAVGSCGVGCEPVALSSLTAINSANVAAYEQSKPPVLCIGAACPELEFAALQQQNYYAECVSGHCQARDVRTTDLSLCSADADCVLRFGTSCCGCNGDDHLIALSSHVNAEQAFCPTGGGCAADCAGPALPPFVAAWCTAGRCVVHYPP